MKASGMTKNRRFITNCESFAIICESFYNIPMDFAVLSYSLPTELFAADCSFLYIPLNRAVCPAQNVLIFVCIMYTTSSKSNLAGGILYGFFFNRQICKKIQGNG